MLPVSQEHQVYVYRLFLVGYMDIIHAKYFGVCSAFAKFESKLCHCSLNTICDKSRTRFFSCNSSHLQILVQKILVHTTEQIKIEAREIFL